MRTLQEEYLQKLKQIQDSYSPNLVMIPGDEPRFIIDANKRTITIPDEFPFLGVLKDTRAETIFFEIDRYFDEHDLSTKTCVVQFSGMSEDEGSFSGIYPVTDLDVDSVEGKIVFGWTITDDVTSIAGDVKFAIRFYTIATDEEETPYFDFCFNTLTSELPVMNTLDVSQDVSGKVDPSILDEWNVKMQDLYSKTKSLASNFDNFNEEVNLAKQEIQKSGQNSVDEILTNKTSAIEEIEKEILSEKESAIESITNASNAEQEKIKSVFPEIGEDDDGKILGVLDGKLVLTQMKNDIRRLSMEQGIVYIIMGILSIALFFVGRYVFPAAGKVIQSAMNLLEAYPMLFKWATSACQYIAKYFDDIPGEQKNKKAAEIIMQIASQVGIEMTEEQARAIAQAAYEAIKNGTAESEKEGALIPEGVGVNA